MKLEKLDSFEYSPENQNLNETRSSNDNSPNQVEFTSED